MDEDIEDFYRSCIVASFFKGESKGGELNCHCSDKGAKGDQGNL
jgi:hypothetical protein